MQTVLRTLLLMLFMAMLTGCALFPHRTVHHYHDYYHPPKIDQTMVSLNRIAKRSAKSTALLAEVQTAEANKNITLQGAKNARLAATAVPKGWGKKTSVRYQGPFNKMLATLSTRAGYHYYEQGKRPANISLVTIDATNQSLKSILDQVVGQLPKRIGIALYPRTRSVIVRYQRGQ